MDSGKFIRLNTALKPPEEIMEKAISLSQKISQNSEAVFVLDGIRFHPHLTVYSPEYPEVNLNKVLNAVKEVADGIPMIKLTFKEVTAYQGFISLGMELSSDLKELHKKVVEKLNPLREGYIREKYLDEDYHVTLSLKEIENVKKYGYALSMALYKPHLTIIRLKDGALAEKIARGFEWPIPKFTVSKLAVYKMGEHGTCRELVKEFDLQ